MHEFRQFDLRNDCSINFNFLNEYGPLKSLAINEAKPEMLALGISSAQVPIYDRRNMGEPMELTRAFAFSMVHT